MSTALQKATPDLLGPALTANVAAFLPDEPSRQRFVNSILQISRGNADLQGCTLDSVIYAAIEVAQIGLDASTFTKECYFIPKRNKAGVWECKVFFGPGAFTKPLKDSGWATGLQVRCVWEGEPFEMHDVSGLQGQREKSIQITHKPTRGIGLVKVNGGERDELLGCYVRFTHSDNTTTTEWYSFEFLEKIRKVTAQGTEIGASWKKFPWAMYGKIAQKQACKMQCLIAPGLERLGRMIQLDNEAEEAIWQQAESETPYTHESAPTPPPVSSSPELPPPAPNPFAELRNTAYNKWKAEREAGTVSRDRLVAELAKCETQEQVDELHLAIESTLLEGGSYV